MVTAAWSPRVEENSDARQILLHDLQSLSQRVQSCQQLSDDKAKVLWYRGRNEVVTQETHKRSTSRGSIYYTRTPAELVENGRRRRKGGKCKHSYFGGPAAQSKSRQKALLSHCWKKKQDQALGQQQRVKHCMTGHVHPCNSCCAVYTALYMIQKNIKQRKNIQAPQLPVCPCISRGCACTPRTWQLASLAATSVPWGSWERAGHPWGFPFENCLKSSSRMGAGKAARGCKHCAKIWETKAGGAWPAWGSTSSLGLGAVAGDVAWL